MTVFDSAKRCIAHVFDSPGGAHGSDSNFQELHICVVAYARGLYALGQTEEGVIGLILGAARQAADTDTLHPAIVASIQDWCREVKPEAAD
jgi:hypothetical protein